MQQFFWKLPEWKFTAAPALLVKRVSHGLWVLRIDVFLRSKSYSLWCSGLYCVMLSTSVPLHSMLMLGMTSKKVNAWRHQLHEDRKSTKTKGGIKETETQNGKTCHKVMNDTCTCSYEWYISDLLYLYQRQNCSLEENSCVVSLCSFV